MASSGFDLTIRADATPAIGAGHVMRCAALAEAWITAGIGRARLVGQVTIPFVQRRLRLIGVEADAAGRESTAPAVLVVDSYDAVERVRWARVGRAALRVIVDDLGEPVADGFDVVWNPNAYGSAALYPGFRGTVLAGEGVIPLRAALPRWSGAGRSTVGVILGGGEPDSAMLAALHTLRRHFSAGAIVVSGDWAPAGWGCADAEMPWRTLGACGRLITAGGSAVWEAAAVGIPTVVVKTAANQALVEAWVAAHGVPTVDAVGPAEAPELGLRLLAALARAASLPPMSSGAEAVARMLADLTADVSADPEP